MSSLERTEVLNSTRRRALMHLLARYGAISVGDAATQIAMQEENVDRPTGLDSSKRKRVHHLLTRVHLPILEEADAIVRPEGQAGLIDQGPAFDHLWERCDAVEVVTGP